MRSDFYESWFEYKGCIKDAPKKNWEGYAHARARKQALCINVCAHFYI